MGLVACGGNNEQNEEQIDEVVEVNLIDQIAELDSLFMKNPSDQKVVNKLLVKCQEYRSSGEMAKLEQVSTVFAAALENSGQFDKAVEVYFELAQRFPESEDAAVYIWNRGRILEEKLNKPEGAKEVYAELVAKHPDHPIAQGLDVFLDQGLMEMSDEELIKHLEEMNQ